MQCTFLKQVGSLCDFISFCLLVVLSILKSDKSMLWCWIDNIKPYLDYFNFWRINPFPWIFLSKWRFFLTLFFFFYYYTLLSFEFVNHTNLIMGLFFTSPALLHLNRRKIWWIVFHTLLLLLFLRIIHILSIFLLFFLSFFLYLYISWIMET